MRTRLGDGRCGARDTALPRNRQVRSTSDLRAGSSRTVRRAGSCAARRGMLPAEAPAIQVDVNALPLLLLAAGVVGAGDDVVDLPEFGRLDVGPVDERVASATRHQRDDKHGQARNTFQRLDLDIWKCSLVNTATGRLGRANARERLAKTLTHHELGGEVSAALGWWTGVLVMPLLSGRQVELFEPEVLIVEADLQEWQVHLLGRLRSEFDRHRGVEIVVVGS